MLTKSAQSELDNAMPMLVPYLPDNPVVVEGYSDSGMPDHEHMESRQRGIAVRQYLDTRFHLRPKHVGVMTLGDHPPEKTGKGAWTGVCLVLVVSEPNHDPF